MRNFKNTVPEMFLLSKVQSVNPRVGLLGCLAGPGFALEDVCVSLPAQDIP